MLPGVKSRGGRPRLGTESARNEHLIAIATQIFWKFGFDGTSIDNVARTAGVSSRTIYDHFKNKANLLTAVVNRLLERHSPIVPSPADLDDMAPSLALNAIGVAVAARMCDPDAYALFRIVTTQALRFPELAAKVRVASKAGVLAALSQYFERQTARGTLAISDSPAAAALFLQMICSALHEKLLFGPAEDIATFNFSAHVNCVVEYFLRGTALHISPAARPDRPTFDSQIWST